jgi:hypothetical protein
MNKQKKEFKDKFKNAKTIAYFEVRKDEKGVRLIANEKNRNLANEIVEFATIDELSFRREFIRAMVNDWQNSRIGESLFDEISFAIDKRNNKTK